MTGNDTNTWGALQSTNTDGYKQADNTRQRHFHKGARAITDHTHLDVGERHGATCDPGVFTFVPGAGEQAALRRVAARVEAEVERDGAARLGPAPDVVELEPHERLDQRALAVRLVAHHDDGRRPRGAAQLGRQRLQLVVRLVEELPRLLLLRVRRRERWRRHWVGGGFGGERGGVESWSGGGGQEGGEVQSVRQCGKRPKGPHARLISLVLCFVFLLTSQTLYRFLGESNKNCLCLL